MAAYVQVLQELLENLVSYLAILARIRLYKNLALNCARFTAINLAYTLQECCTLVSTNLAEYSKNLAR